MRTTARLRAARAPGENVVRGRVPGASEEGRPSSSQNICARVPSGQPSAGIVGELCSQPPLGVAEREIPEAVGDVEVHGVAAGRLAGAGRASADDERRQPAAPGPQLAGGILADQLPPLVGVLRGEQPSRGTRASP